MGQTQTPEVASGPTQQRWSSKRKAAVVLELVRGKASSADLARQHGLTVAEVEGWVERFQSGGEEYLKALPKEIEARHEAEKKELLAKIGELSMQVEILKKVNGIAPRASKGEDA